MYRSLLILDVLNPSTQRALRDCHDMHRNLMRAFPDEETDTPRADQSLLYAHMTVREKQALYVVSRQEPDWSRVRGMHLYQDEPPRCLDALKEKLTAGRRLRFRLLASPTKKIAREGKLSARVFLRTEQERLDWLRRQAGRSGFSTLSVQELEQRSISGMRKEGQIQYTGVLFEGELIITDAEAFWNAYCSGIGPGRSYGLGMLMICRA